MQTHTISNEAMELIMAICNHVLEHEEEHYEEMIDTFGADSTIATIHVYRLVTHLLGEIVDNPIEG